MENMIKTIKISQLFGDKDIEWNLQKTNVLVGKNGMGKSTVLQLVVNTISQEEIHDKSKLCSEVTIELDSNNILKLRKSQENISNLLDLVDEQEMKRLIIKEVRENNHIKSELKDVMINSIKKNKFRFNITDSIEYTATKNETKVNFEFVSTMALNANSFQNIEMGNGKTENILDWQIQNELDRLSKINNLDLNNKFITSLNHMFSESNKSVSLNNKFELEFKFNNEILNFPQLSSGERQVIYILLKVAIATKDNALILMDEPEISLHLSWQEKLLAQIREINPNSQIIIVTHSPAIVMNGWLDCFVDIQDIIVKG
ncbi:MAG: ATP-binding protein [Moraxella sp.]|jgi:predicted ATPase|uniref:AAA family ATPase n=1 Tax=Faucicola osloensis TaxID=34062 RepID=A0A6P1KF37_FAUOS|nr:ATP-binding protein [Moraxella osloensis]MBP6340823.1 ATP-binding protein [Moraxella sp.]MBP7233755.1 ATP-binding protein [Moraxella sp.]QHG09272.1 AAA family ATPase [Moraxella osloensis]